MASRKSPGFNPLGHKPFDKVKLEGPKTHHDDHGPNASVPAKGSARAIPNEHWERSYNLCAPSRNMELTSGSDFVAKNPSDRKTTHLKVNREDH
jgi:hypothetical protein